MPDEVTPAEEAGAEVVDAGRSRLLFSGAGRVFYAPEATVTTWVDGRRQPIGWTSSGVTTATGYRLANQQDIVTWGTQTPIATYATYTYAAPARYFLGVGEELDADSPDFRERERSYRERVWPAGRPTPQGFGEWQPDRVQAQARDVPDRAAVAERYRRDDEQRRERRLAARVRARELLYSWLSPEQVAAYEAGEGIPVVGSAGTRFRIEPDSIVANVRIEDDRGFEVGRVCAHPDDSTGIPTADAHLGQLLALTTDERRFLRMANWSGRRLRYGADGRLAVA